MPATSTKLRMIARILASVNLRIASYQRLQRGIFFTCFSTSTWALGLVVAEELVVISMVVYSGGASAGLLQHCVMDTSEAST
jgi:hypothetical protein